MPRKKKNEDKGIDLTAKSKASRKEAKWEQLGYSPVYSPSGNRKGFQTKDGSYISERQFRKLAGTPMKGSKGYKERQEAKKAGKNFRPEPVDKIFKDMQEAAKKGGMTLEEFMTGKSREVAYSERRTQESHNRFIDSQRREAIKFKRMAGTLTDKQAAVAERDLNRYIKTRDKLNNIREEIQKGGHSKEKRARLYKQYREEAAKLKRADDKLVKKGLVIMDDLPSGESLRYGYYHG